MGKQRSCPPAPSSSNRCRTFVGHAATNLRSGSTADSRVGRVSSGKGRAAASVSMPGRWSRTIPLAVGAPGRAAAEEMSGMRNSDASSNETSGNGLEIGDCVIGPTFLDDLEQGLVAECGDRLVLDEKDESLPIRLKG